MTLLIFGFGFTVTVLIGSALTTTIILKNRALEAESQSPSLDAVKPELPLGTASSSRD